MLDKENKCIRAIIPLTRHQTNIRIKSRSMFYEYGVPHYGGSQPFHQSNYVEWQIGYDLVDDMKNRARTSLPNVSFMASNGSKRIFYELSEYLYHLYSWGIILASEIQSTFDFVSSLEEVDLIFNHPDMKISKTPPVEKEINGTLFYKNALKYPQLIYKLGKFEITVEILIKERQRALGIQPMFCLCFPITELKFNDPILGRKAFPNEKGQFIINETNSNIVIEMIKIFGMLSLPHNHDTIEILKVVLP